MAALIPEAGPCFVPACNTVTSTVTSHYSTVTSSSAPFGLYNSTVPSGLPSANAAFPPHPRLQTSYPSSAHSVSFSSVSSPPPLAPDCPSTPPVSSSPHDSTKVLQWNACALRARSTELLHFLSSHPVDLICIQESNLNSSFSFRIPEFSLLMPRTLEAASSFSFGRANPFLNFLPPLSPRSIPTLIM